MRKHKRIIHRALDGEATRSETSLLRRALQADLRARSEFEELKRIVRDTRKLAVEVPKDFRDKVLRETTRLRRSEA